MGPIGVAGTATEQERWERERLVESLQAFEAGLTDAPLVRKHALNLGGLPNNDRPLTFVASDEAADRLGDVVRADGWDLDAYIQNPVFLWAHDHTRTPVGRSVWTAVDGGRLLTTVEFAPTPFAKEVETLYRQRFLRAVSVGFRPRAFTLRKGRDGVVTGIEYTQQELLEISAVPVPANPRALARALESGLAVPRLRPLFTFPSDTPIPNGAVEEDGAEAVIAALRGLREVLAG